MGDAPVPFINSPVLLDARCASGRAIRQPDGDLLCRELIGAEGYVGNAPPGWWQGSCRPRSARAGLIELRPRRCWARCANTYRMPMRKTFSHEVGFWHPAPLKNPPRDKRARAKRMPNAPFEICRLSSLRRMMPCCMHEPRAAKKNRWMPRIVEPPMNTNRKEILKRNQVSPRNLVSGCALFSFESPVFFQRIGLAMLSLCLAVACKSVTLQPTGSPTPTRAPTLTALSTMTVTAQPVEFSGQRAYDAVVQQVALGPRITGSVGTCN